MDSSITTEIGGTLPPAFPVVIAVVALLPEVKKSPEDKRLAAVEEGLLFQGLNQATVGALADAEIAEATGAGI